MIVIQVGCFYHNQGDLLINAFSWGVGVGVVVTLCIKVTNIWSRTGRQSIRHPPKPLYKCISHSWRAFYVSCTIPKIISCLLLTFPSNLLSNDANGSHLYIFLKIIYWLGLHTTCHFLVISSPKMITFRIYWHNFWVFYGILTKRQYWLFG